MTPLALDAAPIGMRGLPSAAHNRAVAEGRAAGINFWVADSAAR